MNNIQLYSVLYLTTKGAAASFLLLCEPRADYLADGKAAGDGLVEKYFNSSRQRRRILVRQLDGMIMRFEKDPDRRVYDEGVPAARRAGIHEQGRVR